jgi:hypothetical protein
LFSRKPHNISDLFRNRLRRIILRALPVMLIPVAISSCIKEEFNADLVDPTLQINPGVAAPIGWAKYRLDEILMDSLNPDEMIIGADGFISMVYHTNLASVQASEIISIENLSYEKILDNPYGISVDLSSLDTLEEFNYSLPIPLTINGTENAAVDSILVRTGFITLNASSRYPDLNWDVRFGIPGIPDFQVTLDNSYTSAIDTLDGDILPINPADNTIPMGIILTLKKSSGTIGPGPIIDISISISDFEYNVIYGYLGQFPLNAGPQSLPVDFFRRTTGGTFYFADPKLTINFRNSFGLPIQVDTLSFTAIGREGQFSPITGPGIPGPTNPRILAYPQWGEEGQTVADSIVLDNSNTDLFDVLGTSPGEITVRMAGSTNPGGETHDNFLLDTSQLSISAELLLPLYGYADLLLIADTLDFIFADFYENPPQEIRRLFFRLEFQSQFPVDVSMQLYFYDQGFNMLDSLFHIEGDERQIVRGVDVDGNGIAIPGNPPPVEIELSREQIDNISACHFIIARGRVTTTGYYSPDNHSDVRFYSYYYFNTHIAAIAELEMNSDDY